MLRNHIGPVRAGSAAPKPTTNHHMSTKATLAHHDSGDGTPSWHLYEELFEAGVVYLELRGVAVELTTCEAGGANVVLRLPLETAKQLGLHTNVPSERWASACDESKPGSKAP